MSYNYGTSTSTKNWNPTGSTGNRLAFFGTGQGAIVPLLPQFGCGLNGPNTFCFFIATTSDSSDESGFSRRTAWRKAYRFLNRFDPVNINMDRKGDRRDASATYEANRDFFDANPAYVTPFDHKPPCRFPVTRFSNPGMSGNTPALIEIPYSMKLRAINVAGDWDGRLDDSDPSVTWAIGQGGLGLGESRTPNTIEFPFLKTGGPSIENIKVDTLRAVTPAYSGEIVAFRSDTDSGAEGGGLGYMGNDDKAKIYIDITQTDEVLRWNPDSDIKPEEWWIQTFRTLQVKNSDKPSLGFVPFSPTSMEVVSADKNNYIVSFTSFKKFPLSKWKNGDNIRVEFKRKKIIRLDDDRTPWSGAEYENIRYRSIDDEFRDDFFVQAPIEPPILTGACCIDGVCTQKTFEECSEAGGEFFDVGSTTCTDCDDGGGGGSGQQSSEILPFTLSLNGTLEDGTITINYPDGFDATEITFEVYIEDDV